MSDDTLAAMKMAAPMLVYIKRDIHGLRHLLHIIEKDSVVTQQRKAAISVDILAALPAAVETFSGFFSPGNLRPENNTLYDDFVMYIQITQLHTWNEKLCMG